MCKCYNYVCNIYATEIILMVGSISDAVNVLKTQDSDSETIKLFEDAAKVSRGICMHTPVKGVYVWLPKFDNTISAIGTLSHELLHAYAYIAKDWELSLSVSKHEVIAYHTMLLETFLKKIRNKEIAEV